MRDKTRLAIMDTAREAAKAEFMKLLLKQVTGTGPFDLTGQQIIAKVARSAAKDWLQERQENVGLASGCTHTDATVVACNPGLVAE